ncbi:MAG: type IV secretion system DNA-binding domain-containing protein [Chloroflexi bacterium]|nr:type IV secretion system DNA-binding domain-containing protein [Chloroflexota bacterium]
MNKKGILTTHQRSTHTYVIGQPGTGKSRALESWIMQDISAGRGVCVIDPHGDLYRNLTYRVAQNTRLWGRVILVDPMDKTWTVGINPLEAIRGQNMERVSLFMIDIMVKVWGLQSSSTPRLLWLLTNTFLALSELNLTLLDLPEFLLNKEFRTALLPKLKNPEVKRYFTYEFPHTKAGIHQWVTPALNKIGGFLFDPDIRPLLSSKKTLDFREIMDKKKILLVNLSKGLLGEGSSALLGAFIVARLQKAALSRADAVKRTPFYLYLDEFQNYTTDNIIDILAESRKYNLSMTLAHQYLDQLTSSISNAVLNTAGTISVFRVGHKDANRLAKEIFPSSQFRQKNKNSIQVKQVGTWPKFVVEKKPNSSGWEHSVSELSHLRMKEFWTKKRGNTIPTKHRSFNMPDIKMTAEIIRKRKDLVVYSGNRYGQQKKNYQSTYGTRLDQNSPNINQSRNPKDSPFWEN